MFSIATLNMEPLNTVRLESTFPVFFADFGTRKAYQPSRLGGSSSSRALLRFGSYAPALPKMPAFVRRHNVQPASYAEA